MMDYTLTGARRVLTQTRRLLRKKHKGLKFETVSEGSRTKVPNKYPLPNQPKYDFIFSPPKCQLNLPDGRKALFWADDMWPYMLICECDGITRHESVGKLAHRLSELVEGK